jgi:hypothetical protein
LSAELPDGLFSTQKSQIWVIFEHLAMKDVGKLYVHSASFTAILHILWPFGMFCGHFGIFFPFWYVVQRKIWQPCLSAQGLRGLPMHRDVQRDKGHPRNVAHRNEPALPLPGQRRGGLQGAVEVHVQSGIAFMKLHFGQKFFGLFFKILSFIPNSIHTCKFVSDTFWTKLHIMFYVTKFQRKTTFLTLFLTILNFIR